MSNSVPFGVASATEVTVATDSNIGVASDSDDWFGSIARQLLGKDAGFGLHITTGAPEGSCYKYVTTRDDNRRQPPGFLIRQLLRSEGGYQWLAALMDGSNAEWWAHLLAARDLCDRYKISKR